jgi:HEPN domain-containing protein
MKNKKDLIQGWLTSGDADLKVAKNEIGDDEEVYFVVCFHAQQAAEKYIKAYLIFLDIEPKHIHEIGELIELGLVKDPALKEFQERADTLTSYAVEVRYPDTPYKPSKEEAEETIAIAEQVIGYIKNKIDL